MPNIDDVWHRIVEHAGERFRQVRGREFTYTICGNVLRLDTTPWSFSKGHLKRALSLLPLESTVPIRHLMAPSYIFALLTDRRIAAGEW